MPEDSQTTDPYVLLTAEDGTQRKFVLSESSAWTMGRDSDNSIVILDNSVSRHHAILQCLDSNSIYLIDLGSTNGSFVNQRRVSIPTLLQNGDRLTLGQSEIEFYSSVKVEEDPKDETMPGQGQKTSVLHLRRLISVAVVDIRGFTRLTQLADERILSQKLGEWFRRAGRIIRAKGSKVDKYIGDAIMAVWLHSEGQKRKEQSIAEESPDVLQAFHCLQALFEMTQELNQAEPLLPLPIQLGAGINTGFAIVGQMGSGERQEFTVIGDTVNAAFRLEGSTRMLDADIAISEETHSALWAQVGEPREASFFRCQDVELKGYTTAHQVYYCRFSELKQFLAHLSQAQSV